MKDDTDKYKPDVARVLQEMDPARVLERRRETLAKFYGSEKEAEAEPAEMRVSAPSPWSKGGAGAEVDKAALPSAMMPAADVPPMTTPVETRRAKRRWSESWRVVGGLALVAAVGVGLAVGVIAGRAKERAKVAEAMSAAVGTSAVVVPSAAAVPSAPATAIPALSATPVPSATAVSTSSAPHKQTGKPPIKLREPHGDPPSAPAPTATPVEPPPPPKYFE